MQATAFERGCGAMERRNTRVTIHSPAARPEQGDVVLATDGRYAVALTWHTPRVIGMTLGCLDGCDSRILSAHVQRTTVAGVSVEYAYSKEFRASLGAVSATPQRRGMRGR